MPRKFFPKATLFLLAIASISLANENYRCVSEEGKVTFQNWACGEKPQIEKKRPAKNDYQAIVKCGLENGLERNVRNLTGASNGKVEDCTNKKSGM